MNYRFAREIIQTQAKRIADLEAALAWRPINTAPKDIGDIPCIGSPRYDFPVMLRWNGDEWRDWNSNVIHPTHWFKLP